MKSNSVYLFLQNETKLYNFQDLWLNFWIGMFYIFPQPFSYFFLETPRMIPKLYPFDEFCGLHCLRASLSLVLLGFLILLGVDVCL